MNSKLTISVIVIILIVVTGGFYVMNMNKTVTTATPADTNQPTNAPISESVVPSAMATKEITIEAGEFKFAPSAITVKKGEKVKLTFKNTGKFPHDYVIADLNVATKVINPGEVDMIEFTPDKTGEFTFICGVGNHEEQGMTGTLTVE